MNSKSKVEPHQKKTTILPADNLVKTSNSSDIELDEKELEQASGGACCTGTHLKETSLTVRK